MRITEARMIQLASESVSNARSRAASAGDVLSSGIRVDRPSKDPSSWAEGMRADARHVMTESRRTAIARGIDRLQATDGALEGVGQSLSRMYELGVQLANGVYDASARDDGLTEVAALKAAAIAAANSRGGDGEYVLSGTVGAATPPFDANGAYFGNAVQRRIEASENQQAVSSVPGSVLTAASGLDIFGVFDAFTTALAANDQAAIQNLLPTMSQAIEQVANGRSQAGGWMKSLQVVDGSQEQLQEQLARTFDRAIAADPIEAATEFSRLSSALEASRVSAQEIIALATGKR